MKIESQTLDDHQVRIIVEADPGPFEAAKQRAARRLAQKTKIPGFRPGKAPYSVILRHLGEELIIDEAIELLVKDLYPQVIDESGIEPYGPGSLKEIKSVDPPTFEFVVPLRAAVELGDYKSVRVPYEVKKITDQDIDAVIADLQERYAIIEPVDRPAQHGDLVFVQVSGERVNPSDGQDVELATRTPLTVLIPREDQQENPDQWPYPALPRQLLGAKSRETRSFEYTFPPDTPYKSLAGVEARFHVEIEAVKSRTLLGLNDEFATTVSEFSSLEELRDKIRQGLERQAIEEYHEDYDEAVLDKIIELSTIKYPPQMLEIELDTVVNRLQERLQRQNSDIEVYLKARQMDMPSLREELKPIAEKRLKRTLVLLEVSKSEGIEVDAEELQEETTRTIDSLARILPQKEARKLTRRETISDLAGSISVDMLIKRTLEKLRDIARGSSGEVELSQADVTKQTD